MKISSCQFCDLLTPLDKNSRYCYSSHAFNEAFFVEKAERWPQHPLLRRRVFRLGLS